MYGVFDSKEEYDLWMASWNGAVAQLTSASKGAERKADILEAAQAGEVLGDIVQMFGGGAAADMAQRIADYISKAEKVSSLTELIPRAELGSHAELVDQLRDSNTLLAAFARGFARGIR